MERKKFRITNATKLGIHNTVYIDCILDHFKNQNVLFVPEKSDIYEGCRTFYFGGKYGDTEARFIYQSSKPNWRVELSSEEKSGIKRTKSALKDKLGLKFATLG